MQHTTASAMEPTLAWQNRMMPVTTAHVRAALPLDLSAIVLHYVGQGINPIESAELGLWEACVNTGRLHVNDMLVAACRAGFIEIVKAMMSRGATNGTDGFAEAFIAGHHDIKDLLTPTRRFAWARLLYYACRIGHRQLVETAIIHTSKDDWNMGLALACILGMRGIVNLMLAHGAGGSDLGLANRCRYCGLRASHH